MTKEQVREILARVLTWSSADQEKVAQFARDIELRRGHDDLTDEEWKIIELRAARRDLATDEEVEQLFDRYRQQMRLRFERGALNDLDEIFRYIAADNPVAAGRLVARIESVAAQIAEMPHIGELDAQTWLSQVSRSATI